MKQIFSVVVLIGLSGLGVSLSAQQAPARPQPDAMPQQQQTDATNSKQSARSFEGKIAKMGDQFVLQEDSTQAAYTLDDQDKARHFAGKDVRVMATVDASTNTLHVFDIIPVSTE